MNASAAERDDFFRNVLAPFQTYDFRVYDETDNGEFMTTAKVDLIERGKVVSTESFVASSEDAPGPGFSAYGNGHDNHAGTQARSFAWAWIESMRAPFEERYAPFGQAWFEEQEERYSETGSYQ